MPRQERLARTEKFVLPNQSFIIFLHFFRLFVLGYFDGPFPEQSLALDRRRDDKIRIRSEVNHNNILLQFNSFNHTKMHKFINYNFQDIDTDDEDDGSSSTRTYESGISDGTGSNPSGKTPSICSSLSSSRAEFGLIRLVLMSIEFTFRFLYNFS
jgi:hypothetical protein